jgi:hypothetical protein
MSDYNLYKFLLSLFKIGNKKIGSALLKIHNPHHIEVSNNSFTTATEKQTINSFATQTAGG